VTPTHERWAVILAGGEGTRLRSLTTDESGATVPKQYCSFGGGESMLRKAVRRAASVVGLERVVPVVVRHHATWWEGELSDLPADNVIVAPRNRGTAAGLLLPLLYVMRKDPHALVLVLPSDHHVEDEETLRQALERACMAAADDPDSVILLGVAPSEPDAGYGWILPEPGPDDRVRRIASFDEKPSLDQAIALMRQSALWNTFMFVGTATAILSLFERARPELLAAFAPLSGPGEVPFNPWDVAAVHEAASTLDFSRDVLEVSTPHLRVLRVPPCGWSDMGTPERVARALGRVPTVARASGATAWTA
jgi:mannose-1-phosphate guanylyltransferase